MRTHCITAVLFALLLAGCVAMRPYPAPDVPISAQLVEVRHQGDDVPTEIQPASYHPRNVLVLSGGGMNGAYPAGVLKGWTASGQRPVFDLVTGISTGALIAPFALLGPEFDDALERSYTTLRDKDILQKRSVLSLPWADSLADSSPLRHRIDTELTPEVLERIAEAHRRGRRLYIGTTDLDTKRLVIWNMGAIAAGEDPDKLKLFRQVVLASASVPGLLPPVPINIEIDGKKFTELHVDGGVAAKLFLRPGMVSRKTVGETGSADMTVWVIVAGKLRPEREVVKRNLLNIGGESIEGVLQAAFESDLIRIYLLSRHLKARFALAAIPQGFGPSVDSLKFDPAVMRQLFEEGHRFGLAQGPWATVPPGLSPTDQILRGGAKFETRAKENETR